MAAQAFANFLEEEKFEYLWGASVAENPDFGGEEFFFRDLYVSVFYCLSPDGIRSDGLGFGKESAAFGRVVSLPGAQ